MLLTLTGIGSSALIVGLIASRDSATPNANSGFSSGHNGPTNATENTTEKSAEPTALPLVELEIACAGDQLAFSPSDLTAPANVQISLTFENVSTYFSHNWLLVNGGEAAVTQVIGASVRGGVANHFLPKDMSNVIAYTQLIPSGATATVTFDAPPAGEYTFLCTFPGHCLAGMRGTLTITA